MYDERRLQGELAASMEIGLQKGLEKGLAEGLEAGRAEGRAEKNEIAGRMLEKGIVPDLVAEITGLTIDTVNQLNNR